MLNLLKILFILNLSILECYANDILPQNYTSNNINPYRTFFSMFKLVNSEIPYETLHPELYNNESKYSNTLSRLEREWLNKNYPNLRDEDRISQLEEKIFGTIHSGSLDDRCRQLAKAFNAQKTIKSRYRRSVPTSIPMGINEFLGEN